MLSGEHLSDALSACTGKPADASDMCDLVQAQQEVRHLRGVLRRMVLPEEGADPSAVRLRVIAVNDVYELDNLPRLANLVKSCSVGYAEELPVIDLLLLSIQCSNSYVHLEMNVFTASRPKDKTP